MTPIVSIIMGSTSDLPVMEKAAQLLNDLQYPSEMKRSFCTPYSGSSRGGLLKMPVHAVLKLLLPLPVWLLPFQA